MMPSDVLDPEAVKRFMHKVQGLIDKANRTDNEHEARIFLAKADELMVKYSLDPSMVLDPDRPNMARPVYQSKPEKRTVEFMGDTSEMDRHLVIGLRTMFSAVAEHLFVKVGNSDYRKADVFGYPVDLNFLEMFFMKLKLHMFSNMFTTVDPTKPWVEVLVGLKNMGYRWQDIHQKFLYADPPHPQYPYNGLRWERRMGVNFTNQAKKYTELHGLPRNKSSNPNAWREDFVDGYVAKIYGRLRDMRTETMANNPLLPDLIGDKLSAVDELFFEEFPSLRPHPENCECDTCHRRKCSDLDCDRPVCVARRKPVKASSYRASYRKTNYDAFGAGASVASTADLTDKGAIG